MPIKGKHMTKAGSNTQQASFGEHFDRLACRGAHPSMRPSRDNRMAPHLESEKGRWLQGEERLSQGPVVCSDFAEHHAEGLWVREPGGLQ